jgi:hypothetical protein
MKGLAELLAEQARVRLTANHRYYVDGKPMPAVTTITKMLDAPQLDAWKVKTQVLGTANAAFNNPPLENEPQEQYAARLARIAADQYEHERIADEAAVEGSEVHGLIEWRMRTQLGEEVSRPAVSEAAAFREAGWSEWAKAVGLKPLAVEARVISRSLRYCGTIDLLAEVNGVPSLLDWKRSKAVYESHHLQSIAYRMALEEMGFDPMPGYVLLMPPGGDPELAPCRDDDATRAAFRACVDLYNWTRSLARERKAA